MKLVIPETPKTRGVPLSEIPRGHWFFGVESGAIGFKSVLDNDCTWLFFNSGKFSGSHIDLEVAQILDVRAIDLGPVKLEK